MSDEVKKTEIPVVIDEPLTDLTLEDQRRVAKFIEDGMPGLGVVDDVTLYRVTDLYLSGKTYTQISQAVRVNKLILMYLSQKLGWYATRRSYLAEVESNIKTRVLEAKI